MSISEPHSEQLLKPAIKSPSNTVLVKNPKRVLYLPSTPLNILLSFAHAVAQQKKVGKEFQAVMVIIDQKSQQKHPYLLSLRALAKEGGSPFKWVEVLTAKQAEMSRLKLRQQNFAHLGELIEKYQFDAVAVGSDRRIEFQFCMQKLKQKEHANKLVEGWYLDDGLYSYIGNRKPWYENFTNSVIKKLTYGFWWQEPKTVGASDWIQQAWLFDTCNAVIELKNKTLHEIDKTWFEGVSIKKLANQLFEQHGVSNNPCWLQADVCVLLPHPNNIKKMPGYETRLNKLLNYAKSKHIRVAVKYHPRSEQIDALDLEREYGVSIIPSNIAFEFVLMKLTAHTKLIGDVGTALLTAKWLRPEMASIAIFDETNAFENKFKSVLTLHGVQVQSTEKDLTEWVMA